jgi:hypothetical protein
MSNEKFLLLHASGDIDEDEGMTKYELFGMLADELGYAETIKEALLASASNCDSLSLTHFKDSPESVKALEAQAAKYREVHRKLPT